jgi:chemotaxis protein CheX
MKSADELLSTHSAYQRWTPLLDVAIREVFELMLGEKLTVAGEDPQRQQPAITAMVGLAGQVCGVMSIRCSVQAATRMASKMSGAEPAPDSPEIQDAFGEICNMVAGNFKNKIAGLGDNCMLSVPTVITGSDYNLRSLGDSDTIETMLVFEGQPFSVALQIHS